MQSFDLLPGNVRSRFEGLVDGNTWVKGTEFKFQFYPTLFSRPFTFTIRPKPTGNQPGNGQVHLGFHSRWKKHLQQYLQPGFREIYYNLLNGTLERFPLPHEIGCFILLQFEIARRVPGDVADIPNQAQIAEGIGMALDLDTANAYNTMTNMFCGRKRIQAYEELQRDWVNHQLTTLMASMTMQPTRVYT